MENEVWVDRVYCIWSEPRTQQGAIVADRSTVQMMDQVEFIVPLAR